MRHRSWTLHLFALLVLLTACSLRTTRAAPEPPAAVPATAPIAAAEPMAAADGVPVPGGPTLPLEPPPGVQTLAVRVVPAADPRLDALGSQIEAILAERGGTYGVTLEFVPTHQRTSHAGDQVFESASVYKIAVAYAVLRQVDQGQLSLSEHLTVQDADASEVEPEGGLDVDAEVSLWDGLQAMMGVSSNSAAHALMRLIGQPRINADLDALGLHATRVPLEGEDADNPSAAAVTTSAEMAQLLELLAEDRILSPASREDLRTLLAMPKDLDPLVAGLPDGTQVLSKPGNQDRASNVAGLVATPEGPLIVSVFDTDVDPGDARGTIQAITQAAWDAYSH